MNDKAQFIKMCYFWKVFKGEYEMNSLIFFMDLRDTTLWSFILNKAKFTFLPPTEETLPPPYIPGSTSIVNLQATNMEIAKCKKLLGKAKPNFEMNKEIKRRIFAMYGLKASKF